MSSSSGYFPQAQDTHASVGSHHTGQTSSLPGASSVGAHHAVSTLVDLHFHQRALPRIAAKRANSCIKDARDRLIRTGEQSFNVDQEEWWKSWIVHHPRATDLGRTPIASAHIACIVDEHDDNKDFFVVDLVITYTSGLQARFHPNEKNPHRVRFGRFRQVSDWDGQSWLDWKEECFSWLPTTSEAASVHTMRAHDELSAIAPSLQAPTPMPQTQAVATASPLPLEGPAASVDTMQPNSLPAPVVNDIRPQGEWNLYSHPQSRCPWWYCRATGLGQWQVPSSWAIYQDPLSHRYYAVDETTGRGNFLFRMKWEMLHDVLSNSPWWYCRTTGQSLRALPPGWGMYRDPLSGRVYAVDEITQQGHFLPEWQSKICNAMGVDTQSRYQ